MGRTHTIKNRGDVQRIDTMISDGTPQIVIAREMGIAPATLSRYVNSRKSELARFVHEEPGVTEVLSRLIQVADHAREIRTRSKLAGTPIAQTRAVKAEAEILGKLLSELAVDDVTVLDSLLEAQSLITALKIFFRTFPESASDLIEVFSGIPETQQLAQALRARQNRTAS